MMKRLIFILLLFIVGIASSQVVYIDPTYAGENGTENGTITRPYNAFTDFTLQSNYTYLLKRGTTYTSSTKILLYKLTNTTISDYGTGVKPIFTYIGTTNFYAFQFDQCTDCSITNIHLTAPTATGLVAIIGMGSNTGGFLGGTGITVDSCRIENAGSDASGAIGIRAGGNQVKILRTVITDISLDGIYGYNVQGIEIGYLDISDVNRKYFSNTNQTYSSGDGLQLGGNYNGFHIHHTTIDRTSGTGNKFGLILNSSDAGANNYTGIIEYNTFTNNQSSIPASLYIEKGNGIITRYNTFQSSTRGIHLAGTGASNHLIHNNIFYDSTDGILVGYGTPGTTKVYNNVFYSVSRYHIAIDATAVEARNNIHLRGADSGIALYNYRTGTWTLSNNCYGDVATAGTPGTGTNSIVGDPEFVNAATYDFHLTDSTSICVNTGIDVDILEDFDGNSIPQFILPDIGAYEVVSTPVTPPVVPPVDPPDTVLVRIPNKGIGVNGVMFKLNEKPFGKY